MMTESPGRELEGRSREVLEGHGELGLAWNRHSANHHNGVLLQPRLGSDSEAALKLPRTCLKSTPAPTPCKSP